VVTGDVNHADVVNHAATLFSGLRTEPEATPAPRESDAGFIGSLLSRRDDDIEKAHVAIAFEGVGVEHPDTYAFMVMQQMLGNFDRQAANSGESAYALAAEMSTHNLGDSAMSYFTQYSDTGLFGSYFVCGKDEVADMAWLVLRECLNLVHHATDSQVERAATALKTQLLLAHDGVAQRCDDVGRQLMTIGRRMPLAETMARIDAVDAGTVRRVANTYINDNDLAVAAHGPLAYLPDYNWLRRRTYMLRY